MEEIKFVLEKLKGLEVEPVKSEGDSLENQLKRNKKYHLFYLMPLLTEFVTTNEKEVKIIIKEIFKIISNEIGIR